MRVVFPVKRGRGRDNATRRVVSSKCILEFPLATRQGTCNLADNDESRATKVQAVLVYRYTRIYLYISEQYRIVVRLRVSERGNEKNEKEREREFKKNSKKISMKKNFRRFFIYSEISRSVRIEALIPLVFDVVKLTKKK